MAGDQSSVGVYQEASLWYWSIIIKFQFKKRKPTKNLSETYQNSSGCYSSSNNLYTALHVRKETGIRKGTNVDTINLREDTTTFSRQSHSYQCKSGVSPLLPRRLPRRICIPDSKKRTMSLTSLPQEKTAAPFLICDSPVSPEVGSRRLFVGTGSQPYIFRARKQVSPNSEGFDKENQNVTPKNSSTRITLRTALCEKKNIMHIDKMMNSSQVQCGNMLKEVGAKRKIAAEKENLSTTCQFPVRRSKRTKKENKPFMQLMQDGTRKSPREDFAVEGDGSLKTDVSVKVAKSKQKGLELGIEVKDSQCVSKRTSKRIKNLNFSVENDMQVIQRTEVQVEKGKSPRSILSSEQRTRKKDFSRRRSERVASIKEATVLTGRTLRRKVDKNNSSPQSKPKGLKDEKRRSCNKVRNSPATDKNSLKSDGNVSPSSGEGTSQNSTVYNHTRKMSPNFTFNEQSSKSRVAKTSKSKQNKCRIPIWASEGNTRRTPGKRRSLRVMDKGIYEFEFDSSEEVPKKRHKTKRRNQGRRTKPKPRTKQTLLTTDPNWEDPLSSLSFPVVSSSSGGDIQCLGTYTSLSLREGNESVRSSVTPSLGEDIDPTGASINSECNSDDLDTHDNQEDDFEGFEFETVSSFVAPQEPSTSIPMTSVSVTNTPAITSQISKYIGGSSTPRDGSSLPCTPIHELREQQAPRKVADDIATCFGFDDTETEDDELNLSPVRFSGLQSRLEVTGASDIMEVDAQLTRFSWCSLKPGSQSYVSAGCTSSMLVHDRSKSSLSCSSSISQPRESTHRKTKQGNIVDFHKKKVGDSHCEIERTKDKTMMTLAQPVTSKPQESDSEHTNTSLLFDEEEAIESQMKEDKEKQNELSQKEYFSGLSPPHLIKSPEKSFSKLPKRSYDRILLEKTRRKFIRRCLRGNISTGTDSEDDAVSKKRKRKKKHCRPKKDPKKKKETKLSKSTDSSSLSNISTTKRTKASKKDTAFETSFNEWVSDINSHFSEVDDCELVVS
ncbi:LOW QUALITY PROTEIN: uncharacterized protein [Panulirus ornatus]|uniref:LOW QUALITY PROTEIN: uncharacterized protein n=1 Tax=Panulirus ornatus TaxID=150431 RepID=UPI003A85D9BF